MSAADWSVLLYEITKPLFGRSGFTSKHEILKCKKRKKEPVCLFPSVACFSFPSLPVYLSFSPDFRIFCFAVLQQQIFVVVIEQLSEMFSDLQKKLQMFVASCCVRQVLQTET